MVKRLFPILSAALLALALASCEPGPEGAGTPLQGGGAGLFAFQGSDGWEFQKNMHKSAFGSMAALCKAEAGYYFQFDSTLYYMEGVTGKVTELCARPDCSHDDKSCGAYTGAYAIWYSGGRLYFAKRDFEKNGESFTELGKRVYSVNPDGTGRQAVMSLELQPTGGRPLSSFDEPICHRGTVYFIYNGVLYLAPLEGDAKEARRIWGEEYVSGGGEGGYAAYDPDEPHYTLWADGDTVYFMLDATGKSGDTVFVYRLDGTPVREIPLGGLFETLGEISGFYPVFIDGEALWLVADAGKMVPASFGSQKARRDVLCRVGLETGKITEITRWEDQI